MRPGARLTHSRKEAPVPGEQVYFYVHIGNVFVSFKNLSDLNVDSNALRKTGNSLNLP